MKNMKRIPKFKSEDEEREFWSKKSPLNYFDVNRARLGGFPNLKPTLKSISLRLPQGMIDSIKILANKQDVPYQTLIKIMLSTAIAEAHTNAAKARKKAA